MRSYSHFKAYSHLEKSTIRLKKPELSSDLKDFTTVDVESGIRLNY